MLRHAEWADWHVTRDRPEARLSREMNLSEEVLVVLGCGTYTPEGAVGVDSNPDVNPQFVCDFETEQLPLDDHSVDAVASNHVAEHVLNLWGLIEETWRVLKPGGRLLWRMPYAQTQMAHKPSHVRMHGEDWWVRCVTFLQHFEDLEFDFEYDEELLAFLRSHYGEDCDLRPLRRLHWNFCTNMTVSARSRTVPLSKEDVSEGLYNYRGEPYEDRDNAHGEGAIDDANA